MLSSSLYTMLTLSMTTSPQKTVPIRLNHTVVILYIDGPCWPNQCMPWGLTSQYAVYLIFDVMSAL